MTEEILLKKQQEQLEKYKVERQISLATKEPSFVSQKTIKSQNFLGLTEKK